MTDKEKTVLLCVCTKASLGTEVTLMFMCPAELQIHTGICSIRGSEKTTLFFQFLKKLLNDFYSFYCNYLSVELILKK